MTEVESGAGWESATLEGGPADGVRVRVPGRPGVLQVTYACEVESGPGDIRVAALHVYRLRRGPQEGAPRYGFDGVSP